MLERYNESDVFKRTANVYTQRILHPITLSYIPNNLYHFLLRYKPFFRENLHGLPNSCLFSMTWGPVSHVQFGKEKPQRLCIQSRNKKREWIYAVCIPHRLTTSYIATRIPFKTPTASQFYIPPKSYIYPFPNPILIPIRTHNPRQVTSHSTLYTTSPNPRPLGQT